jgi:hypothetical protein
MMPGGGEGRGTTGAVRVNVVNVRTADLVARGEYIEGSEGVAVGSVTMAEPAEHVWPKFEAAT